MKMIKREFGMIWEHKIILATLLGIMFIPFLYSVFFLKSVWDPYGNVDKLPVAVVNDDRPVTFQDKQLDVGDQLVANMKKQDGLEWHFVSAQKAKEGMSHHKYYMVVTVPKNFSKNAATVLNDKPQKMNLKYQTNDSLNYIGHAITKETAGQLKNKVSKTVSTAYADTMFGVVKQVGAGFGKAAKGAVKLSDGSKALSNGLTTYTAGVKNLNDGVMTLHAGVEPLSAGIVQLADGSLVLDKGLHTYTAAVSQVNQGVQTLRAGTVPLASGVSQLQNGAQTLSGGINQYTGAVGQLNGGLQQLAGNSKQLQQAAGQLSQLPQGVAATYVLGNTVSDSVVQLIKEKLPKITAAQNGLNSLMTPEKMEQLTNLGETADDMNTMITNFSTQLGGLTEQLNSIGANDHDSAVKAQQVLAVIEKLPAQQQEQMAGSKEDLEQIIKNSQENGETLKNIQAIKKTVAGAKTELDSAQKSLATLSELTGKIKQLSEGMNSQGETLDENQLTALESAAEQLKSASTKLNARVNGQKSNETYHYPTDRDQIRVQISQIADQSSLPTMLNGLTQYTNGVKTAANGASQLNQNGTQLRGGASQLNGGLTAMGAQVPTLVGGINTLANGTSQLNANGGQLVSGADTLAGGIGQLNAQVPTLVNGIDTLANGSAQLAGNSDKLNGASGQVAKGTGTLSKSLKDGAKEVNSTNLGKRNAQMFAAPTRLQHSNYSKVPNYGFALAPYMLSVALYVGALVFNLVYPLRKMGGDDSTANEWFGSKAAIGGVVAVANALVELLLMMAVGLTPQNVGGFLLNGIMFSLAAMYIVMLLSIVFDNPGRFIGMILLVIQLGASGGSFPIEITTGMNGFFQAINPFLPMTWSVYSFRESLTGGFGSGQITQSFLILLIFIVVSLVLLWVATQVLHNKVTYEPGPSSVVQESGNGDKE